MRRLLFYDCFFLRNSGRILLTTRLTEGVVRTEGLGMNYVLWAVAEGDPLWKEQIITETSDRAVMKQAMEWARNHGFGHLRVLTYPEGDPPVFGANLIQ